MQPPKAQFLYEAVAGDVVGLIEGGALRSGDQLPSVRRLSRERGVSVSTVLQAYRTLEDRGCPRVERPRRYGSTDLALQSRLETRADMARRAA